ncbi:MAG: DJ-1/PfpI/YhbO family deglycase/protease [Limnoraphis robusta]|uniref:DJ-1/PfpI family protein n=1 Tax=Limnoraphis robusta CS-951 TaxID=1637645 RepID=A0A0F5YJK4_9CYAN|nr:DJ-1/PfpI/YhbO family deglycase/protease [Limnoraphis robusta]KKD39084.1 DJ-1/PfpI family protein [Limnoraphis robusta CS-951]
MTSLSNGSSSKRVAILLESGFEDSEFQVPYTALRNAGANTVIIGSRMNDEYQGKQGNVSAKPDATAAEVRSEDFDAIFIPGGAAPDKIRSNPQAVRLVIDAMAQGLPIAAICHGPQVLIDADVLDGKQATGYKAIRKDIHNAGATYVNEPVVVDGNLITARQPSDLPMFTVTLLNFLNLQIEGTILPHPTDLDFEWWTLGEAWKGSSRNDIINVLNTAIVGERYTLAAFKEYSKQASDPELVILLREGIGTKERHVELLEARLRDFGEQVTWQAVGSEAFAKLQGWLQSNNSNDQDIMRRALGDIQTGVIDCSHLCVQITDPVTAFVLEEIEENLRKHEELIGTLYRVRSGENVQAPMPTTIAAS